MPTSSPHQRSFSKAIRLIGFGVFSFLFLSGIVYAASGFRLISLGGMNFASFFDESSGNLGIEATSFHAKGNDTWISSPVDGANHISGTTYLSGNIYFGGSIGSNTGIITASGRVGIGTMNPTKTLDVAGDINFTNNLYRNGVLFMSSQWIATGSSIYYNSGNVGIGTINPLTKLDIYDNSTIPIFRIGTSTHSLYAGAGTGATVPWIGSSTNSDFILVSNSQPRMIISSTGNVALVGSGQLTLLNTPIASTDAVNKAYVDAQVSAAGGTSIYSWYTGNYHSCNISTMTKRFTCIRNTDGTIVPDANCTGTAPTAACVIGSKVGDPAGIDTDITDIVYAGIFNGYKYFTTAGNCTNSVTPTCNHGTDNLAKKGAPGPQDSNNGAGNTTYIAAYYSNTAANYCADMIYGGYSDWYLPARAELNFLYQNKTAIGDFASVYWSSTGNYDGTVGAEDFTSGYVYYDNSVMSYFVRCIRKQ